MDNDLRKQLTINYSIRSCVWLTELEYFQMFIFFGISFMLLLGLNSLTRAFGARRIVAIKDKEVSDGMYRDCRNAMADKCENLAIRRD